MGEEVGHHGEMARLADVAGRAVGIERPGLVVDEEGGLAEVSSDVGVERLGEGDGGEGEEQGSEE